MRQVRRAAKAEKPKSNWDLVGPAAHAVERLWQQEIDLPERPEGEVPGLPEDLTDLSDSELMSLFGVLTSWVSYMGTRLAVAEVDESSFDAELKMLESLSAARNSGAKNVTTAKAKVYEDEDYVKARDGKEHAYAYRKIMTSVYEATDKKAQLCSRELTRRVGRDPRDSRNARWNA